MERNHKTIAILILQIPIIYLLFWVFVQPIVTHINTEKFVMTSSIGAIILILFSLILNISILAALFYSKEIRTRNYCLYGSLVIGDLILILFSMPLFIATDIMFIGDISIETIFSSTKVLIFSSVVSNLSYSSILLMIISFRIWNIFSQNNHEKSVSYSIIPTIFSLIYAITIAAIYVLCYGKAWIMLFDVVIEFFLPVTLLVILSVVLLIFKLTQTS